MPRQRDPNAPRRRRPVDEGEPPHRRPVDEGEPPRRRPEGEPPRRRRPTIDDVAARAGVSSAAVSFAMNDRPGVGEATRRRILDAAAELGWRPSAHARGLAQARAHAIGLLLARPVGQLEIDPFFVRFLAGIERTLARSDHALVLRVSDGPVDLGAYERLAASGRVDGFLLCDVELNDPRFGLIELPAVVAGHPVSPCPFPWLETEHARGIGAAVEHLIGLGHRRIGFCGSSERFEHIQARLQVWRETLEGAGLEPGPVAFGDPRPLLDEDVTAIVHASDVLAAGGLAAARERGIDVPGELSLTGFDDSPLAALASPPLTSVRIDYAQFGEAAAAALLAAIAGEPVPAFRGAPPELVVRASTAQASRE
jgi:DNA-binding LacI/PurR family transcriptional regulator